MWRPFVSLVSTTCANSAQCSDHWHTKQPEHLSRHLYQVAWTIVIHCVMACLTASSAKFSPSRMPPLSFWLELDEGTTSRQFCISCTGFLSRDVSTSNWHVSFTRLSLARHLHTWLTTYTWFKVQDISFAHPPTDRALFHAHTTHLATEALLLPGHVFGTASQYTCPTTTFYITAVWTKTFWF